MPAKGQFAEYLASALWTAYGPLIKVGLGIACIVAAVLFIAAFWSKVSR